MDLDPATVGDFLEPRAIESARATVIDIFDGSLMAQPGISQAGEQAPVGTQGRDAQGPYLVTPQSGEAFSAKPLLPAPDDGLGLSGSPLDLAGGSRRIEMSDLVH
jgi:hypothetical protein